MATSEMERHINPMYGLGFDSGRKIQPATHLNHMVVVHTEFDTKLAAVFTNGYVDGLLEFFSHRGINLGKNTRNRADVATSIEADRWMYFKDQPLMREGFLKGLTQRSPSSEARASLEASTIDAGKAFYANGYKLGAFARFVKDAIPPIEHGNQLEGIVSVLPYTSFKDGFNGRPRKEMQSETEEEKADKAVYDQLYEAGLRERMRYNELTTDDRRTTLR